MFRFLHMAVDPLMCHPAQRDKILGDISSTLRTTLNVMDMEPEHALMGVLP